MKKKLNLFSIHLGKSKNRLNFNGKRFIVANKYMVILLIAVSVLLLTSWQKATNTIWTPWGEAISDPNTILREYPRPQMVRGNWENLNGVWKVWEGTDINFTGSKTDILVPFPLQSALSGVKQNWHYFVYERNITIPAGWSGKRVLLQFGAVDWQSEVFINGVSIGGLHKGGYDPFYIDITDRVASGSTYRLNVRVYDPTDADGEPGPTGKQSDARWNSTDGIWYTPSSGIWQTAWMEAVPATSIRDLKIVPNIDNSTLQLTVTTSGSTTGMVIQAQAKDGSTIVGSVSGSANSQLTISIPNQKLWSPSSPFLYNLTISLLSGSTTIDQVESYFGMRKISLGLVNGITKMLLNNQFVFQMGPLDQGFWPDGLYTPPSEAAIIFDLQGMKDLGYNMVRKHIKVEPARWYYNADRIGLMVWQDMPNGSNNTTEKQNQYMLELERMVRTHWNHPSIIMWVTFNEQWGIFNRVNVANFAQNLDPSRLINENSACCGDPGSTVGHLSDYHYYSPPNCPAYTANRALANGEYGGLVLVKAGHIWNPNYWSTWALLTNSDAEYTTLFVDYCKQVVNLRDSRGMSAAVVTQWTDVEGELNGNYTYDRKIIKGDVNAIRTALQSTYNGGGAIINPPSGYVAWRSHNVIGTFIRHKEGRGRIDNGVNPVEDAYWKMVPGLAGAGVSFQSLNFPNTYLRHRNGEVWQETNDGTQIFFQDATFYQRAGLADGSKVSFESYNFPGRYIRHRDFLLYSEAMATDLDRSDATFSQVNGSVINVPVTGVSLSPNSASITIGGTQQLTAAVLPTNATNKAITWSSGNTSIATVNSNGLVTGIAAGSATITVRTTDGGYTATCAVTVNGTSTGTDITNLGGIITTQYTGSPANEGIAMIIDNNSNTKFLTFYASAWVQYQAPSSYIVTSYTITSANDAAERDPLNWTLQGSNNGSTWTTINTQSAQDFATRLLKRTFSFANSTAYTHYRFNFTNNSGTILQVAEVELFGTAVSTGFTTTIQAENYSTMAGVATETTTDAGGGLNVGWIEANDYMAYPAVTIPAAGTYTIEYRVASMSGGGSIRFELAGGSPVYGTIAVPSTGGWQTWSTIKHTVTLPAGSQSFAIVAVAGGWNINWFAITQGVKAAEINGTNNSLSELLIYPNPVKDLLTLSFNGNSFSMLSIMDMSGKIYLNMDIDPDLEKMDINLSGLNQGIYIVRLNNLTTSQFFKVMKL